LAAREHAILAEIDLLQVLAFRDDRKHHIACGEFGKLVGDLAAVRRERFRLGPRAIPDRHVMTGLEQSLGHRRAHAPRADPADLLRILRHPETPLQTKAAWQRGGWPLPVLPS